MMTQEDFNRYLVTAIEEGAIVFSGSSQRIAWGDGARELVITISEGETYKPLVEFKLDL